MKFGQLIVLEEEEETIDSVCHADKLVPGVLGRNKATFAVEYALTIELRVGVIADDSACAIVV